MRMLLSCLVGLLVFCLPTLLKAELVDRVVAVVNDEPVTLSELNEEGRDFFRQIIAKAPADQLEAALDKARREVLSSLINKKITAQKAKELGITVADQEVDEAVNSIMTRNNVSAPVFKKDLEAMGSTEENYRRTIRDQILRSKLLNQEVRTKVVITDEKARAYYDAHYTGKKVTQGYNILQMGFSWKKTGDGALEAAKTNARQRAEQAREQAVNNGNFRELAKSYSDLPSAAEGGDIGVIKEDEMAPYMRQTILAMQPGEISPLVETDSGYQFFKLLATEQGGVAPYEAVQEEIRELLYQEETEKYYEKWVKDLRKQYYIKELL
ncbi:MAG: hypothetical protein A2521_09800 [Deltaproteobacteria bacterium RIFOXYD12_FULL_57_12]|nr:MAG: hypothetical protein A2521_09800 [Deltaproteobacteria bacterium RIFOXYD12_FULL_57_12]